MTPGERRAIADALGLEHFHMTARGTTALWASMRSLAPAESRVLVPANVCEVVVAAILHAGLIPQYVDVDPIGGNVTVDRLEAAWTPQCKTLVAVHHFGTPLPMDRITPWARDHDLVIIEDCASAMGATWQGRPVGTFSDVAVYSFGYAKILDLGFGGLVASTDSRLVDDITRITAELRPWGKEQVAQDTAFQACLRTMRLYDELREPTLYRALYKQYTPALLASAPSELCSRIADTISQLPDVIERRQHRAAYYRERLTSAPAIHRPSVEGEVCWRYTFHLPTRLRNDLVDSLRRRDLPVSKWFPAVDRLFAHRGLGVSFPGADQFEHTVVNLFVSHDMDHATVAASADAACATLQDYDSERLRA